MKCNRWLFLMICLVLGAILALGTAPVLAAQSAPETFACVAGDQLEKDVAPEAALEDFSCYKKQWAGAETLHFKVAVKNVSDKPQRYRINIFLDNGKAVGGLLPRKVKKGLIQPGQTASFSYPVQGVSEPPGRVLLKISAMSQ